MVGLLACGTDEPQDLGRRRASSSTSATRLPGAAHPAAEPAARGPTATTCAARRRPPPRRSYLARLPEDREQRRQALPAAARHEGGRHAGQRVPAARHDPERLRARLRPADPAGRDAPPPDSPAALGPERRRAGAVPREGGVGDRQPARWSSRSRSRARRSPPGSSSTSRRAARPATPRLVRRAGSRATRRSGSRGTPITASQPPSVSAPSAIRRDRIASAAPPRDHPVPACPIPPRAASTAPDGGQHQPGDRQAERVEDDEQRAEAGDQEPDLREPDRAGIAPRDAERADAVVLSIGSHSIAQADPHCRSR